VEAVPLKRGKIEAAIRSSANLEAEIEVSVFARTANRVKQLLVEEGDQVEKDQLLLKLEDYEQRIQAEQADARLEKIRRNFERTKALYEQQLVSEQVYADSQSELRQAELAAKQARLHLDYTEIRSPISGTVARRYVSVGDFVNTGMRLFDLVDFNSLAAPVYVPDKYLSELAVNQKARVRPTALPGQEFLGYVNQGADQRPLNSQAGADLRPGSDLRVSREEGSYGGTRAGAAPDYGSRQCRAGAGGVS